MRGFKSSVFSLVLCGMLAGCGGGGGGAAGSGSGGGGGGTPPAGVLLTGTVAGSGGSGMMAGMESRYSPQAASANEVWAIPIAKMQGANISPINLKLRKTTPLPADGSFEFDLPKTITAGEVRALVPDVDIDESVPDDYAFDVDWLVVTVDTSTNPVKVVSQVRLGEGNGYGDLYALPISGFAEASTTLELGSVAADGTAQTTTDVMTDKTTLSSDSIKTLARADDVMQALKDIIRNCDISTGECKSARQSFVFMGDYAQLTSGYDPAVNYSGYQFYFDVNDYFDTTDFDAVCDGTRVYTLAPPGNVTVNGTTYNATNPMSTGAGSATVEDRNGGAQKTCGKNNTFLSKNGNGTTWTDWMLQFITGDRPSELTSTMPAGDWVLSRDGIEIGRFEFRLANPIDSSGKPIVFVPALQLTTSPTTDGDKINSVAIKWYRWDGTAYVEISGVDLAMVQSLIGGFDFSIGDWDGKTGATGQHYPRWSGRNATIDTSIDLSGEDFYYNYLGSDHYNATYIGVYYQFGGQGFRFAWRSDV